MRNTVMLVTGIMLMLSTFHSKNAEAAFIPVEDWHLTTDAFGGLRQHVAVDSIYYAVHVGGPINPLNEYEAIKGYRFASFSEYVDLINNADTTGIVDSPVYRNQGGWSNYVPPGSSLNHVLFRFSDTSDNKMSVHASHNMIASPYYQYQPVDNYQFMAGFVMIKEDVVADVPAPMGVSLAVGLLFFLQRRSSRK